MWKYKTAIMIILALIFSLMTSGAALAHEEPGSGVEAEVNGYHVRLVFPGPAKVGSSFQIVITSPNGSPVSGAEVAAAAQPAAKAEAHNHAPAPSGNAQSMDDMSGMDSHTPQSISTTLKAGEIPGEYNGTLSLPEAGRWMLTIHFMTDSQMLQVAFPLEVAAGDSASYGILGGFFGLNVVIILAAAVMRRKAAIA